MIDESNQQLRRDMARAIRGEAQQLRRTAEMARGATAHNGVERPDVAANSLEKRAADLAKAAAALDGGR